MPRSIPAKIDFRARAFGDALAEGIVRVQDDRPVRADRFRERAFFRAIASRVPMNSMCATPMFVMIATSGAASFASAAISPG